MDWLRQVVEEEDYMIGDLIQKGLQSGAHSEIVLGKNEKKISFSMNVWHGIWRMTRQNQCLKFKELAGYRVWKD